MISSEQGAHNLHSFHSGEFNGGRFIAVQQPQQPHPLVALSTIVRSNSTVAAEACMVAGVVDVARCIAASENSGSGLLSLLASAAPTSSEAEAVELLRLHQEDLRAVSQVPYFRP